MSPYPPTHTLPVISPGAFLDLSSSIPSGQASVIQLLEQCYSECHGLLSQKDPISGGLRPIYEVLIHTRRQLEEIYQSRHTWSLNSELSQTERLVTEFQKKLAAVEYKRIDGKFSGPDGESIPQGQAILHFLLHKVSDSWLFGFWLFGCLVDDGCNSATA